jgi:phosphoglycerol transferase MdoB-like AlkP superfamily enzyme
VNRVLDVACFIMGAVGLTAITAKLVGWKGDPVALFLRLPPFALILSCIVISGISAEIVALPLRACLPSRVRRSERTRFGLLIVLWILIAVIQITFLVRYHQPLQQRWRASGGFF